MKPLRRTLFSAVDDLLIEGRLQRDFSAQRAHPELAARLHAPLWIEAMNLHRQLYLSSEWTP